MTSLATGLFEINGVISTDKTVWANLDTLASAARSYLTFDYNNSKWSVIINKPTATVKQFNDSNIIGAINITGSGITEMYNRVQIEFPHKDMMDKRDTIMLQIPDEQRFANEPDNMLSLSYDIINDPVQASMIALTELKQSRLDKIIDFSTDFTALGLKAGDVIEVTQSMYNFTNKKFRIITIDEADIDDGSIVLKITALEYDESVYDYSDIDRYKRDHNTGIVDASNNDTIAQSNAASGRGILYSFFVGGIAIPATYSGPGTPWVDVDVGVGYVLPQSGTYKVVYFANWGNNFVTMSPVSGIAKFTKTSMTVGSTYASGSAVTVGGGFGETGNSYNCAAGEDHYLSNYFSGTAGQQINFGIKAITDYGEGQVYYGVYPYTGELISQQVPAGTTATINLTVDLYFLG